MTYYYSGHPGLFFLCDRTLTGKASKQKSRGKALPHALLRQVLKTVMACSKFGTKTLASTNIKILPEAAAWPWARCFYLILVR